MKTTNDLRRGRWVALSLCLYFCGGLTPLLARTFDVTNHDPSGPGSLHQALSDSLTGDTIVLDQISGQTINLTLALPSVPEFVQIKNSGAPVIIDGTNAGTTDGLTVNSYAVIQGLKLQNCVRAGVRITGAGVVLSDVSTIGNINSGVVVESGANNTTIINLTSSNNLQSGLFLTAIQYLHVTGNTVITNNSADGISGTGVNYSLFAPAYASSALAFGPPLPASEHLVISGNGRAGIRLDGANYNVIRGAYIGTDATGTVAQPNADGGIILTNYTYTLIGGAYPGQGNLISGNGGPGLNMGGPGSPNFGNQVFGNFFGTNINGTAAIGSSPVDGIVIDNASENLIGENMLTGPTDWPMGRSNLFSGNRIPIMIENPLATLNVVRGNFIGTDFTGTAPLGNDDAVTVFVAGAENMIGGSDPGDGNVIAATNNNNPAVRIDETSETMVQDNSIGTDLTGEINLGNTGPGISILYASNTTIGGRDPGEDNVILNQGVDGIRIDNPNANNNFVAANSIFLNAGEGLNLQNGANNSVLPPVVDAAVTGNGVTTVSGSFTGPANTEFFIDLYASPDGQVGSSNQGRDYLGGGTFATLANGTGTFAMDVEPVPSGTHVVNATKTDPAGNTSGFATATTVVAGAGATSAPSDGDSADLIAAKDGHRADSPFATDYEYFVVVQNNGPGSAQDVTLTDVVPNLFTITSCKVTSNLGQCVVNGNTVTGTFGTLTKDEPPRSITISVRVRDGFLGAKVKNTARVTSTTPDPKRGNNVAKTTMKVVLPSLDGPPEDEKKEGSGGIVSSLDRISTFDTDVDGWTATNSNPLIHKPSGGNPDGYAFLDNDELIVAFLKAPPKFLGDLSAFNGGTLSFDGNLLEKDDPFWPPNPMDYGNVTITGANGDSAMVDFVPMPDQPPEKSWKTFSELMTAEKWHKTEEQWQALLEGVTDIKISIEAVLGKEMEGVDNIKLLLPQKKIVAPSQSPNAPVITAGITEGTITLTLPNDLVETVTVDYETVDGTAVAGEDYVPLAGTLIFPPGTTSRTINTFIIGDDAREADETFSVKFSNPVNATLENPEVVVTILDDDGGLANISTRLAVGTGINVLIGGFIIPDVSQSSETKKVLLRAIGPSLPLTGKMADPKLALFDATGAMIAMNDNWRTTQIGGVITSDNVAAIEASTIPPTEDSESAMVIDLPPAAYTAILSGVDDSTGIALVEAYDLDDSGPLRLANISTRGFVDTVDNVMIGGLITIGDREQTIVARAIGPSLVDAGIPDALMDPVLELYDGNGTLVSSNDNWRSDQEAEIIATALAPTDDAESAILATLVPGAYTGIVRGAGGTTGVGLVEFYRLD